MEDEETPTTAVDGADQEDTAQDTRLGPGTEVHGYVIDGEIGKGGMGFVYSATHPLIGKRAAIKVLKPEVSKSPIILERFIQEARAVNQIGHPNIIDIFAFGALPDGRAYHVMDLLVGETLRKRLRRGPLHPSEAASVIEETSQALTAAHECGFVHRDLKPDNIFLVHHDDRWPEVKLLDFGLAKLMPEAGIAPFTTKAGVMLGTPEYMSPEQARGIGVDYRTDVYALGVLTFEILAGQRPFPSLGDAFATLQAHAEEPPLSLGDLVGGLPTEMVQLVDAMLAKEPGARPSLAAVRTVIKRLRSTQLPTRTAAGLEIASFQGVSRPDPAALGISASHLGADPMFPSAAPVRSSQMRTPPQPSPQVRMPSESRLEPQLSGLRQPQHPPLGSQPPMSAQGAPSRGTQPPLAAPPGGDPRTSRTSTQPPARSTHGGRSSTPDLVAMPNAPAPPSPAGLAAPAATKLAATKLGVAAPPRAMLRPAPAAAPPRRSRLWLIIGALLAIAAGVALALVLVGG